MELEIRRVAPDSLTEIELMHELVKTAFADLDSVLSVPTSGGRETLEAVKTDLLDPAGRGDIGLD